MDFTKRISSRKFIILVIGIALFCIDPKNFTGDNLVILMGLFIGGNITQKFLEKRL